MRPEVLVPALWVCMGCYASHPAERDPLGPDAAREAPDPLGRECLPLDPPFHVYEAPRPLDGSAFYPDYPFHEPLAVVASGSAGDEAWVEGFLGFFVTLDYHGTVDPTQHAARVRYRVRFGPAGPVSVLEEATPATVEELYDAWDAAIEAPLTCVRAGDWDLWIGSMMASNVYSGYAGITPPELGGLLVTQRRTGRVWTLDLQVLPLDCRDPDLAGPCRPELGYAGSWVFFGVPAGTVDEPEEPRGYCPLQPVCDARGERRYHLTCGGLWMGSLRCELGDAWLDELCAARTLDELPLPSEDPCHMAPPEIPSCVGPC